MSTPRYPTVHVRLEPADADLAGATLWELGATGIEERDDTTLEQSTGALVLIAHFGDDESAQGACAALADRWDARVEHIVGDDWRDGWKRFFRPTRVGEHLVVRPPWEPYEAAPGDVVITLDPGAAFGTGTHETTRLAMREIERLACRGDVLDVGCGSGILGIVASLLGARRVRAIDVDPIAVRVTGENASINGVTLDASTTPIDDIEGTFALVLANIRGPILVAMADALVVRTAGRLVLGGLLTSEEPEVREPFDARLELEARNIDGEWLALTYGTPK